MNKANDPLIQSRHGLAAVIAGTVLIIILIAAFIAGDREDALKQTRILIESIGLHTPALFPTGHASRDAGYRHPAIDLRHSPLLPLNEMSN